MTFVGRELAERDWVLRSGGSPGADSAFEQGCDQAGGRKEIFLPWSGFNGSHSELYDIPAEAFEIARQIHPRLGRQRQVIQKLRARNVCQALGETLNNPSDLVVAWTERGMPMGGTATALSLAATYGIPVINLANPEFAQLDCSTILARILGAVPQ